MRPLNLDELKEIFVERKTKNILFTLKDLYQYYNIWYHLPDRDYFDLVLAMCLERKIQPDVLVWMYVVANSGNFKSEFYRGIKKTDDVVSLDRITENTLVSGKERKVKGKMVPVKGMLSDLDGKILVFKDFTSILTMHTERRRQIIGQLRHIYDGEAIYGFGQSTQSIKHYAKFGFIAFTTPMIDKFHSLEAQLGSRFLSTRHHPFNKEDARLRKEKIRENKNIMKEIRETISWLTWFYLSNIDSSKEVEVSKDWEDRIYDLADYVAYMRSSVDMTWKWGHPVDPVSEPQREETTRIYEQMLKISRLLCYLRQKTEFGEEEWQTLIRVGEDSITPHIRSKYLNLIRTNNPKPMSEQEKAERLGISRMYLIDVKRIMNGCGILDENYDLTPRAKELIDKVYQ